MGIVAVVIASVFVRGIRTYSRQIELAEVRANLRLAMATLTSELRGLDAADPLGGDIAAMGPSFLTYRATRSTHFLCEVPDLPTATLTVWQHPHSALRMIEPGRDSVLLFAENDGSTSVDNIWLAAALNSVTSGAFCPGGEPGLRFAVQGLSGEQLAGLSRGAAVRGFQMTTILLYSGADGRAWVGLREWRPGSGWSVTQPILGPVADRGLRFEYLDAGGGITTSPRQVARIRISVVGVGYQRAVTGVGSASQVRDSLAINIGLRNNPRNL